MNVATRTAGTRAQMPHRSRPIRVLPLIEVFVLALLVAIPFVLSGRPELITLSTNILILSLLAMSFDLCWGFSGIMSYGQALFFGVAGYVVALVGRDLAFSQLWATLPLAMLVGGLLSAAMASFLLLGKKTPTSIFVAAGRTLFGVKSAVMGEHSAQAGPSCVPTNPRQTWGRGFKSVSPSPTLWVTAEPPGAAGTGIASREQVGVGSRVDMPC